MSAPICHIPPGKVTTPQPGPKPLPAIPVPHPSIEGLMATVNAMRLVIERITNQLDKDNGTINNFRTNNNDKKVQWVEDNRVVEKVKIYQNNDPTTGNFVEVEQINRLVMKDKNTGQTWSWDRERK